MVHLLREGLLPCLYAFLACLGFCALFQIRGLGAVFCSLGGALAWLVYLVSSPLSGGTPRPFWALDSTPLGSPGPWQ